MVKEVSSSNVLSLQDIEQKKIALQIEAVKLEQQKQTTINKLVETGLPMVERYLDTKIKHVEKPKFQYTVVIIGVVLLVVIVGSMILVWQKVLGSDAFTFLMGIVVGYLMTFFREMILVE